VVGEVWLRALLNLRLGEDRAGAAADGWDGATYRAWSDRRDVAVILSTVWDSPAEAREFRQALARWIAEGSAPALVIEADGPRVHAAFASTEALMPALASAMRTL
jgi:hypothetical protein